MTAVMGSSRSDDGPTTFCLMRDCSCFLEQDLYIISSKVVDRLNFFNLHLTSLDLKVYRKKLITSSVHLRETLMEISTTIANKYDVKF